MARDLQRDFGAVCKDLLNAQYDLSVVYDIGANDGRWTKDYGRKFCPGAHFYQFEANPHCSFRHKGQGITRNIVVLSDEDDKEIKFYTADTGATENTGYSYYQENSPGYQKGNHSVYKTRKLDTFAKEKEMQMPNIVKMDTQGSEVDILRGGAETLFHAHAIHCEVPIAKYNTGAPGIGDYIKEFRKLDFIATGVEHVAIRNGVVSQLDMTFMKINIIEKLYSASKRFVNL